MYVLTAFWGTYIEKVAPSNTAYPSVGGVVPNIFTPSNERQFVNALIPIDVIFSGITINDVRDTQSRNKSEGNSVMVKPNGMLAVNKDVQLLNIALFITSIVSGSTIDFKDVHP